MAFEGVASTSASAMGNSPEGERIEMNTSQFPNYQTNHIHEPNTYGAVDEEDDLDENLEEKCDKDVSYRKFIYNNSEQFKSICGGECFHSIEHFKRIKAAEKLIFFDDVWHK